jgi:hypothetical protein
MAKKDLFARFTIAITGDFGKERKQDDFKRWIELNGGKYSNKVTDDITHLVCSKAHYKAEVQAVQQAKKIKSCNIVTYDWLEDCIHDGKKYRPKGTYSCRIAFKESVKEKADRRKRERKQLKRDGKFFLARLSLLIQKGWILTS